MPDSNNTVTIPIVTLQLPDLLCVNSLSDFVQLLPQLIAGEASVTITNVTVGNIQPLDSQRDNVWFRKDNAGNFIGIYIFSAGTWQQMYPTPKQRIDVYRNPTDPLTAEVPPGYTRFDLAVGIDPTVVSAEVATWTPDTTNPGYYLRYSVVFTGF